MNAPSPDTITTAKPAPDRDLVPESWFAVPIWTRIVLDHERINAHLVETITKLEAESPSVTRSNVGGWHSISTLHHDERFADIRRVIARTAVGCARHLAFDFDSADLVLQEMWANRNGRGDFNRAHMHPNSILSGSYYVKVPPESGNLEFYDPVRERIMTRYPISRRTRMNSHPMEYRCREGMLVIFPSWLQHSVQPSRSDDFRISLAFNLGHQRKPAGAPNAIRRAP